MDINIIIEKEGQFLSEIESPRILAVYGVPKRNADRPAWGNYAAAGGNINRRKREFWMRRQAVDRG